MDMDLRVSNTQMVFKVHKDKFSPEKKSPQSSDQVAPLISHLLSLQPLVPSGLSANEDIDLEGKF